MTSVVKMHVGVDVSKNHLDICFNETKKALRVKNNRKEITQFICSLKDIEIERFVYEATGGYENLLTQILATNDLLPVIVNPRRIRSFAVAKNVRAKTDKIDAEMIAAFAASECCDDNFVTLSPEDLKLRELTKRRSEIVKMCTMEKIRLTNPRYAHTIKSLENSIEFFDKQIDVIDDEIYKIINGNDELKKKQEIMETMVGVGRKTSQNLIGSLPELGNMENKKIAALVGVAPIVRQSGQKKGYAKIEYGRSIPKQTLYLAVISAIRFNPVIREFYKRLRDKGKKPKVAIVAAMRKMLVILNTMIRKREAWNPLVS
jgi:transposase